MKIQELIQRSGFSRRTIYYYTQIGLLPPPKGKGKNFEYSEEHLQRLLRIRELQRMRYSLKEIQDILSRDWLAAQEAPELKPHDRRVAEEPARYPKAAPVPYPRRTGMWVQLAAGLELFIQWPLTPEARRFLQTHLPEVLTLVEDSSWNR